MCFFFFISLNDTVGKKRAGALLVKKVETLPRGARSIATFFSSKAERSRFEGIWRGQRSFSRTRTRAIARAPTAHATSTRARSFACLLCLPCLSARLPWLPTRNSTSDESIILLARFPLPLSTFAQRPEINKVTFLLFLYFELSLPNCSLPKGLGFCDQSFFYFFVAAIPRLMLNLTLKATPIPKQETYRYLTAAFGEYFWTSV